MSTVGNTVEAVLRTKLEDGIQRGLEATKRAYDGAIRGMQAAASSATTAMMSQFGVLDNTIGRLQSKLLEMFHSAGGGFKQWGLGIALVVGAVTTALVSGTVAIGQWLFAAAKKASMLTELKFAYEGLVQSTGWAADTLSRLKKETEGLVSSTVLLQNVNRIMGSGAKVSADQYVTLTGNIFKLAKAAGVDGAQALTALADGLIKGNARGLAAIGIHIQVKDAVSEMAAMMGQSASQLETESRKRAYYNELLQVTQQMVAKLPPDFISAADAVEKAERSWQGFVMAIGEGINRSRVLQELMKRAIGFLDQLSSNEEFVKRIARGTNQAIVGLLEASATVLNVLGLVSIHLDTIGGIASLTINTVGAAAMLPFLALRAMVTAVYELMAALPGAAGRFFKGIAEDSRVIMDTQVALVNEFAKGATQAFSGYGQGKAKLDAMAAATRSLAGEMSKFTGEIVLGTAGLQSNTEETNRAADAQKKLQEATERYYKSLHWLQLMAKEAAKDRAKADAAELQAVLDKIAELNRQAGLGPAAPAMNPQQAPGRDIAGQTREDMLKRQQEWDRIQEALRQSNDRNTPDWMKPLIDFHLKLQELNQIGMDPFHQTLNAMKNSVADFGAEAGMAFANFFADLVSGQEGAGKKLLAAFMGMVGQMLAKAGAFLIQAGIIEVTLASTVFGRFLGANHAAGMRAIVTGAILAAAGGAMMGAASVIGQTNNAASQSGTSFQSATPRPYSGQQVQVLQVGAAGRAQSAQEAQVQRPTQHEVIIRPPKGWVVEEVRKDVRSNGPIRTLIQANAY